MIVERVVRGYHHNQQQTPLLAYRKLTCRAFITALRFSYCRLSFQFLFLFFMVQAQQQSAQ